MERVDLSLIDFDSKTLSKQIKVIARNEKMTSEKLLMLWIEGSDRLSSTQAEKIMKGDWLMDLNGIDHRVVM